MSTAWRYQHQAIKHDELFSVVGLLVHDLKDRVVKLPKIYEASKRQRRVPEGKDSAVLEAKQVNVAASVAD